MPKINLTDYMPTPDELDPQDVLAARNRAAAYLAQWWPELDTRPNSVFGDIHLTPYSVMVAGLEVALEKVLSDLNLANVAQGKIFNATFVEAYLRNFGVVTRGEVPSSGVIKLTFSANKSYVIDLDSEFTFNNNVFKINETEGSPVVIYERESTVGARVLIQERNGNFVVLLPVTGVSGVSVKDGTLGSSNLTHSELISVEAAGDFDSGVAEETLASLAFKAQNGFAAASLSSRSGALSFIQSRFPQLLGATVVVTGDKEMIRDNANPLGVAEGTVDIYARSRTTYSLGESVLPLVYDSELQGWVGKLDLPVVPAFFALKDGAFQVGAFNGSNGISAVYARSNHPSIDNLGVAYSKSETLGLLIEDAHPENYEAGYLGEVSRIAGPDALLSVFGEYASYFFSARTSRRILLRFDSAPVVDGVTKALATVRDRDTGETVQVYFSGNSTTSPSFGMIDKDVGYTELLNGLNLEIRPASGTFVPADLMGAVFEFSFKGRTANFSINYLFDPSLVQIDSLAQDPDNKPAGVTILAKSMAICYVDTFTVHYRSITGTRANLPAAQQEIFAYLNGLIYPQRYEESKIGEIMLRYGASGVAAVTKQGTFYPSLAKTYISKAGVRSNITRFVTGTLVPPTNDLGFGPRNVGYLVALETIKFNSVR